MASRKNRAGKSGAVLALEFSPDSLRYVELLPEGETENQVLSAGHLVFSSHESVEDRADRVRSALESASAFPPSRSSGLIVSVPGRHAFLRWMEPAAAGEDPVEHRRWDMAQYLARPLEAYALDFQATDSGQGSRTLAAAYRLSEIEAVRALLAEAGLPDPETIDLDVLAVLHSFAYNYPECLPERTLIVKADAAATVLVRTLNGAFLGATVLREGTEGGRAPGVALPGSPVASQERAERLLRRARKVSDGLDEALGASGENWADFERVFLCGDLAGDPDFRELLKTTLQAPYALLNPFRKLSGPNPEGYPEAYPGAPFAATVGLALRAASDRSAASARQATGPNDLPRMNLLRDVKKAEATAGKASRMRSAHDEPLSGGTQPEGIKSGGAKRALVAALVLILVAAAGFLLIHPELVRDHLLPVPASADKRLDSLNAALESQASSLVAQQQEAALAWLREMETSLPLDSLAGIHIHRVVFTYPDAFSIRGSALSAEVLSNLQESIVLVPGLDLLRSEARPADPAARVPGHDRPSLEFLFAGTFKTPADSVPVSSRVLRATDTSAARTRFLEAADSAGIAFSVLPSAPATQSGNLQANPLRITATGTPEKLRMFLENEYRRSSPFGIQRILLENNGDSIVVSLDIMTFSR